MDKQKADRIITEYLEKIYGFACKKAFSYDEAEELSSLLSEKIYTSLLAYSEDIYNIEGFIWRLCEHNYAKFVAANKRHEGISIDGADIPYDEPFFEELDGAHDEILRLRREIAFLSRDRRKIVYSFYYENKSIARISGETGIPEGTVKWHLNKAKKDLKEGIIMERKIGKLGLNPVEAGVIGHSGHPGNLGYPMALLEEKLNLNIVYSVYFEPKTKDEIAEELGVTPVFIEDKINVLESNGILVRKAGGKYTTYVNFKPQTYSRESDDKRYMKQYEAAKMLVREYVPQVRAAVADFNDIYIPSGNRELFEALAIFYGICRTCIDVPKKDIGRYRIKSADGGDVVVYVELSSTPRDPDYSMKFKYKDYGCCGAMMRGSDVYPVNSISWDTRYCSRGGYWKNNLTDDYVWLYEAYTGLISDDNVNGYKFRRLRERGYLTDDGKVNIMVAKGCPDTLRKLVPAVSEEIKDKFAAFALECAMQEAKDYPPQMQDYIVASSASGFIGSTVALMVLDILYGNGTFKPLAENEKTTAELIMFADKLPQ